jgi:hypothetical protein
MQDTGKFRKNTKDQYYTQATVATACVKKILDIFPCPEEYQWIEPAAGNGAFLKAAAGRNLDLLGIDLEPKGVGILQGDFLAWAPLTEKRRIFFGNPPFGRQGSIAKSFIKHAAAYADIIAFILPRSFVKPSMSRAFPLKFHCLLSEELDKNAFEVNGEAYDVPCVFQIWVRGEEDREAEEPVKEVGFSYVAHGQPYHIAFRRVGGLAGKCFPFRAEDYGKQMHYFLRLDAGHVGSVKKIIEGVNERIFPSNTVGPRSLSKSEANEVLNEVISSL